jgi:hypothetical protein
MNKEHFITKPQIVPVLPREVRTTKGKVYPMWQALPITRAVLMEAVEALKQIPGGAKRTSYSLERALFHLQRVRIRRKDE